MASRTRLEQTIRRHMAHGWSRAVFAAPRSEDGSTAGTVDLDEEVLDGCSTPSATDLDALVARALAAAAAGRVKQTFLLADRSKVRVDARHGRARVQQVDEETLQKMMGGKDRTLRPDTSATLLQTIGIMNADGTISARHAKKYKQVNHFVELVRPLVERHAKETEPFRVLDLGCGNAYLTFVLAEYLRLRGSAASILGVDVRPDVIERSRARARALGWEHLRFHRGTIEDATSLELEGVDLIMALHACDTATDDALHLAIARGVPAMLIAPCCQHELASQLDALPATLPPTLTAGLFKRDFAALLTDALRVEVLQAFGYRVDTLEFVGSEHTPKNLLIRATRSSRRAPRACPADLDAIAKRCAGLGVRPHLLRRLEDEPLLGDANEA